METPERFSIPALRFSGIPDPIPALGPLIEFKLESSELLA
jgi:hypothetical protein